MSILKSFAPFIAYSVVANRFDWRLAIAAGLVALIAVVVTTKPVRLGVIGFAQLVFLVLAGAYATMQPESGLQDDLNAIGMVWIAVVSAASILMGHPFTLDYSTDGVDPDIVRSPLFMKINRTIAWVWTTCFAACAAAGFVAEVVGSSAAGTIVSVVLLVAAIKFTAAYPDRAVAAASTAPSDGEFSTAH